MTELSTPSSLDLIQLTLIQNCFDNFLNIGVIRRYFWTPRGQLLRNKRKIPVTNIAEPVEYVLPPHNIDVTKPRALNTFLDGLAELGVDKGLIKNKKLLSDLIEKEKGYRNAENTSDIESNNEESSLDI